MEHQWYITFQDTGKDHKTVFICDTKRIANTLKKRLEKYKYLKYLDMIESNPDEFGFDENIHYHNKYSNPSLYYPKQKRYTTGGLRDV